MIIGVCSGVGVGVGVGMGGNDRIAQEGMNWALKILNNKNLAYANSKPSKHLAFKFLKSKLMRP